MSPDHLHQPGDTGATVDRIEEAAADWLARRNGGLTEAEQREFTTWLGLAPAHGEAFAVMEQTWSRLNEPRRLSQADVVWADIARRRRQRSVRRRGVWSVLAAAAAIATLAVVRQDDAPSAEVPASESVAARPVIRTLADGSKVALNAGAEIEVSFSPGWRRVRLSRGEALFTVAKDASRPFVVTAGSVQVCAVGTEFAVHHANDEINVLVTEGRVSVDPANRDGAGTTSESALIYVEAGHRVVVPAGDTAVAAARVSVLSANELADALAWRGRRLEFSEMALSEAVELFNRRGASHLSLVDPALGHRAITGILWEDDANGFVRLLETGFDLVAERDGQVIRLRARGK